MPNCSKVIALIDMDCFYVQVEERDNPTIKGQPAAVVQYNAWKGGGIIAVNYEARAKGVNRHMRGDDAKAACPEIILVSVPELRGKADLTKYRTAGSEVIKILSEFTNVVVERASVDEAYLDLTPLVEERMSVGTNSWDSTSALQTLDSDNLVNNFVVGSETSEAWFSSLRSEGMIADVKLAIGADIVGQMRTAVFKQTGFRCSAGVAHNKVLAKLVCGINKPNKQTVLPLASVAEHFTKTQVKKIRNLGGKLGDSLKEIFNCDTMADLGKLSEKDLSAAFGNKTGSWLYHLGCGDDDEPVTARQLPKSIGCNKNFTGREALKQLDKIKHWIDQLCAEVVERLRKDIDTNNRRAKTLTLHVSFEDRQVSKSCGVPAYDLGKMTSEVHQIIEKIHLKNPSVSITSLGLIASKFEHELDSSTFHKIDSYFSKSAKPSSTITTPENRKGEPSLTLESIPVQELSTSVSISPKPCCSTDVELPFSPKPSTSKGLAAAIAIPQILSTKEFFERVAEAENWVACTLDKMKLTGISDHETEAVFNRNIIQSETDGRILNLGKPSSEVSQNVPVPILTDVPCTKKSPVKAFTQKCERCGQSIVVWDLQVHMDYHYAKDVQREMNGLPPLAQAGKKFEPVALPKKIKLVAKRKGEGSNSQGNKRGRGENVGMRSIQTYFTPMSPPVQTSMNQ